MKENGSKLLTSTTLVVFCMIGCFVASCVEEERIHYSPEITSPAFGASKQSLEPVLKWHDTDPIGGNHVFQFDVYLGTTEDNLELVASDLFDENFRCSSLKLNTTYFWKVVAKANGKSNHSEVGRFVTASELQKLSIGGKTIVVYPGDYIHPDPSSLTGYMLGSVNAGASSWEDGELNTKAILDYYGQNYSRGWGVAADYCDKLNAYGYNDWYLPAILEINAIVNENNLVNYEQDEYWSSTEFEKNYTLAMTKSTRYDLSTGYDTADKFADGVRCRCVRED